MLLQAHGEAHPRLAQIDGKGRVHPFSSTGVLSLLRKIIHLGRRAPQAICAISNGSEKSRGPWDRLEGWGPIKNLGFTFLLVNHY